jgi:hypothetical protein
MILRALVLASLAACAHKVVPWTDSVVLSPSPEVIHVDEGKHCFDVVVYGTPAELATITHALHEVCIALRDPALRTHLASLGQPLDEILEPTALGNPGSRNGGVSFYVVAAKLAVPSTSQICVDRSSSVRGLAVDRAQRLAPDATALLVNAIAHEVLHLYSKAPDEQCHERFTDSDDNRKLCHDITFAVGNAAACSYLSRNGGGDWQACMVAQAAVTPGFQHPAVAKDELGCDK